MRTVYLSCAALAACFANSLAAQPSMPVLPASFQQTMTTAMVGFTPNQTARLSVLNLNAAPTGNTTTAASNCNVELQFLDAKNNSLKQAQVTNLAPQNATSLDLAATTALTAGQTPARAEIRGAVVVNPASPSATPVPTGFCTVFVSLEIFDNTTGNTVALTTDTRTTGIVGVVPLLMR